MNPEAIEFIGEDCHIRIIPNFSFNHIHLITGSIGPFRAGIPVQVPLWVGMHLRKQQKCRIVTPEWMDTEYLEDLKEEEKRSRGFVKMPSDHYMIISKNVLGAAIEDIPNADSVKTLIKDIFDIRTAKLRTAIDTYLASEETQAKLDNITMFELHSVRPFATSAMDVISKLERATRQHNVTQ